MPRRTPFLAPGVDVNDPPKAPPRTVSVSITNPAVTLHLDHISDLTGRARSRVVRDLLEYGFGHLSDIYTGLRSIPPEEYASPYPRRANPIPDELRLRPRRLTTVQFTLTDKEQETLNLLEVRVSDAARRALAWALSDPRNLKDILDGKAPNRG